MLKHRAAPAHPDPARRCVTPATACPTQALEREGVDTLFAYPGGASMEIHQALTRSDTIRNILCRHEQVGTRQAWMGGRGASPGGPAAALAPPGSEHGLRCVL